MKKIDIIKSLCEMGNTEGVGVFTTPETSEDITDFVKCMFGQSAVGSNGNIELAPNTEYVYSYGDPIGRLLADKLIYVDELEIFLYEIED